MPLHLVKLCVGCDSVADLEDWIKLKLKERKRRGQKPEHIHTTRMLPKRAEELTDGGSLYWVIKGQIAVRQKILDLKPVTKNGTPHCGIVYDKELVPVNRRHHRAFQGWRYFDPKDAPADLRIPKGGKGLPEELQAELVSLGLL